jgi:hypothetical protein
MTGSKADAVEAERSERIGIPAHQIHLGSSARTLIQPSSY